MALGFESLECWKKARQLRLELMKIVNTFPKDEKYQLVSQLTRASRSVTANIAEGNGRFYYQENIAFCRKSRGSLFEIKDHLITAIECRYINNEELESLGRKIEECITMLNGYINYLKKKKQE
jgi:four helix bundle protein